MRCPLDLVRETTQRVCQKAQHVTIESEGIDKLISHFTQEEIENLCQRKKIDPDIHFSNPTEDLTLQYLFVLDALNFCFWPEEELEYHHLSIGLSKIIGKNENALNCDNLIEATEEDDINAYFDCNCPVPLADERARLVREIGYGLKTYFDGLAINLVKKANGSASNLVSLVTQYFPGFRDECIYDGRQVFIYKRAQIFVADIWGSFNATGIGSFYDIDKITMFADYRVPVILREFGILMYDSDLEQKIRNKEMITSGSIEEVEIRSSTICAVERIKAKINEKYNKEILSIQLDWYLWETAEANRKEEHHRTFTIFY